MRSPDPEGLAARIAADIRLGGPIPFSAFMERALYDPVDGYYASGSARTGKQGDFFTNVSVGPAFGEVLARQVLEIRDAVGGDFRIVEQGANDGRLARDILTAWEAAGVRDIAYSIIEPFPELVARQREMLEGRTVEWFADVADLPRFRGVHLSNELFDAFPAERVIFRDGRWHLLRVDWTDDGFAWLEGEPFPCPLPAASDGFVTEVRTATRAFFAALADRMESGAVLAFDYGYPEAEYLAPHRAEGTLACFRNHKRDANPFCDVGSKDISVHVNFTDLARDAREAGFRLEGFTDQHHFLVGAAADLLREREGQPEALRGLRTLLHPETMGRQFHSILFSTLPLSLSGFQFARDSVKAQLA